MNEKVLFVAPAKLYPSSADGIPLQHIRQNVSLPALTVLGSLKTSGFEVEFMDLTAEGYHNKTQINDKVYRCGLPDEEVVERISETKPLALMVTSMFSTEQRTVDDLTAKVTRAFPSLPIIVGGIHATLQPNWILESGNVDYVVLGEGEETAPELLRALREGNPTQIGSVVQRNKKMLVAHSRESLITGLDRPWALEDILMKRNEFRYNDLLSRRNSIYDHLTKPSWTRNFSLYYSRGCPIHCDYCASSERDGFRIRHAGSVRMFNDFKLLHENYDVQVFYNQADTFGFHSEDIKFLELVKQYRGERPNFVMNNPNAFFVRIFFPSATKYNLDEDLLDLLQEAGFNVLTIAIETFNQRFNKKIDFSKIPPPKIKELFEAIHARGMKSEAYMMYSFPSQTREELMYDESVVERFPVDDITWQNCMVFPGTAYYRQLLNEGRFTEESYRRALEEGYFFHQSPEVFNFSKIPTLDLRIFRERYIPNF